MSFSLAELIKKIRESKKLSQADFGKLFDPPVTQPTVGRWERGRKIPDRRHLPKIASLLNLSLEDIFEFVKELETERIRSQKLNQCSCGGTQPRAQTNESSTNYKKLLNKEYKRHLVALQKVLEQEIELLEERTFAEVLKGVAGGCEEISRIIVTMRTVDKLEKLTR